MSDGKFIDSPPGNLEGWRRVWQERSQYRGRTAPAFFHLLDRMYEALFHPRVGQQRDYNIVLADHIRDLRHDLDELRRDYAKDLEELRGEFQKLIPAVAGRNDALIAALDQKIEAMASRARDLSVSALRHSEPAPKLESRSDFLYRRLEDALRGSPQQIRQSLAPYIELARQNQPVIDVGCGRGEFLELCREEGVEAKGYDSNERSVAELRAKGLNVEVALIPDCIRLSGEGSVGMIFASDVVEHLPFEPLVDFFVESSKALRSTGLLVIETPNAESLRMIAGDFWRDPTHLAPRHVAALTVLGREVGLDVVEAKAVHPPAAAKSDADDPIAALLGAPLDLRVILSKR
jgi:O-antigen chain-terminating methyltransferase